MSSEKPTDGTNMAAPPPYSPPTDGANMPMPGEGAPLPYPQAPAPGFQAAVYPPAQPGYPPAQPGYGQPGAPPQAQYAQQMVVPPAPQTIMVTSQQNPTHVIAVIDQCPNCKMGDLREQFTLFGILCAFFFFPFGIICCMMSRHKICPVCGTAFHGR